MAYRYLLAILLCGGFASFAAAQPNEAEIHGTVVDSGSDAAPVTTAWIAFVSTESVETPWIGTYDMTGGAKGALTIGRKGDDLRLSGTADGNALSAVAKVGKHEFHLPLGPVAVGIISHLGGGLGSTPAAPAQTARMLVVTESGGKLKAVVHQDGKADVAVTLTRKKEALVAYGTYQGGMKVFAQQAADYYKSKGYTITMIPGDWEAVTLKLVAAEESGHTFSRFIISSHGGWDGPMFEGKKCQLSAQECTDEFGDLIRAMRRGLTPDAKMIFSACHTGGSNRYEDHTKQTYYDYSYIYSDDVAAKTGRTVAGPMGETSTEYTRQLVMAVEGEGVTKQETRVSTPSGGKTIQPGHGVGAIGNQPLGAPGH
jgi:hypothetical protein